MADLRQCPFCGEKERLHHVENITGLHYIECGKCGAAPSRLGAFDYETAIRYWNGEVMPNTNGNRIRKMTDEQLADFFCQISQCCLNDAGCSMCPIYDGCAQNVMCVEMWLKQEAAENEENADNSV